VVTSVSQLFLVRKIEKGIILYDIGIRAVEDIDHREIKGAI